MAALAPGLELVVDYGWLTIIAVVHADDLAALAAGQLGLDHRRADRADALFYPLASASARWPA